MEVMAPEPNKPYREIILRKKRRGKNWVGGGVPKIVINSYLLRKKLFL